MKKIAKRISSKKPDSNERQYERFLEAAREAEASKNPKDFDKAFEKVSKAKPKD